MDKRIDCVKHDLSNSYWQIISEKDIPQDVLVDLHDTNVVYTCEYSEHYEIWSCEDKTGKYRMTYCVDKYAVIECFDDLSNVRWSNESYYICG